jgi:hypothetical protein
MIERRLVMIQLQRWVPQTATIVVSVPVDWTDEDIKVQLRFIYDRASVDGHEWTDAEDFDPREGTHEVSGEADPTMKVDLVYPEEEDDVASDGGEG